MKTEIGTKHKKFNYGDIVECDSLIEKMMVTESWWEDKTYTSKTGDFVYRLAFLTKSGNIDRRRNFRRFEECRLTIFKHSTLKRLTERI